MELKNFIIFSVSAILICFISSSFLWTRTEAAYRRNGEIFNIGWIFSMPYDIGNTLRAPLAGPLSIILTACLSVVLFFSLAASPVYYLFGTPKRKYHVNDAIQTKPFPVSTVARSFDHPFNFFLFNHTDKTSTGHAFTNGDNPTFLDGFFLLLNEDDENCRKLLVCHSHGFLTILPTYILHVYRIFSRRAMEIPADYQKAIQIGLQDQGNCAKTYTNCTKDPSDIAKEMLYNLFADPNQCGHT